MEEPFTPFQGTRGMIMDRFQLSFSIYTQSKQKGECEARTRKLLLTKQVLCQLS
jgi:hypothetical protein